MAFVAVLPTVGTILGTLGTAAASIPLIGPALGAVGTGLGAGATALGTAGAGLGSALYGAADGILGGFLPNLGGVSSITPASGWLGSGGLGVIGGPGQMFGSAAPAGTTSGLAGGMETMFAPGAAQGAGYGMMPAGGGFLGGMGKVMSGANAISSLNPGSTTINGGAGPQALGIVPGSGGRPDGIGGVVHDIKGAGRNIHGQLEEAGVGKLFDMNSKLLGLRDAYYGNEPGGGNISHAGAAQLRTQPGGDQPGVVTIPASNAGAARSVNLTGSVAPNPFAHANGATLLPTEQASLAQAFQAGARAAVQGNPTTARGVMENFPNQGTQSFNDPAIGGAMSGAAAGLSFDDKNNFLPQRNPYDPSYSAQNLHESLARDKLRTTGSF